MTAQRQGQGRLRWPGLLLEFLSVLLGVLAAFAVEEWRTGRENRDKARVALTSITREIEANRAHLEQVRKANLELENRVDDGGGMATHALGWGLQRTAWDVAQSSGAIQHLDYDTVLALSSLYQFQQTYLDLIHGLASAQMVAVLTAEGEDPSRIETSIDERTRLYLDVLAENEKQLLAWYERSLSFAEASDEG